MSDYELNEKDIDSVINFLKIHDPENVTPENAISLLEDMKTGIHDLAHSNPDLLDKLNEYLNNKT